MEGGSNVPASVKPPVQADLAVGDGRREACQKPRGTNTEERNEVAIFKC